MTDFTQRFVAAVVLLLTIPVASADDWPRWMGPHYDGVWTETNILNKFAAEGPEVVWRQKLGAGYAGPSVANGRVFAMDRIDDKGAGIVSENGNRDGIDGGERVVCLDVETGEEIWSHSYESDYKILYPTGPRCTPTVEGDFVYTLGAMGDLNCLNVDDGAVVWSRKLTEDYNTKPPVWGYSAHPYIDGDNLLVPVGGEGSGLVAFNKATGKEVWKSVTTADVAYAPVVIFEGASDERQLLFWHGEGVTSLNPADGREYWFCKFPEAKNPSIVSIATPVLVGNRLLIAEFYKGAMLLELSSNPPGFKEVWRDAKKKPKQRETMNAMITTPVVKDGFAYGVGYTGRGEGVLRCIEVETGETKWTELKWIGEKPLAFASGFITPHEDRFFIFDDIGELIICRLTPDGFEELDRAKLLEPTSVARGRDVLWSHPAYANGQMVARNDKGIICVDLRSK